MPIHRLKKVIKTETTFSSTAASHSMPTTLVKVERLGEGQRLENSDYSFNNYFQQEASEATANCHKLADLLTKSCSNNTGAGVIGATIGQLDEPNSLSDVVKSTVHTDSTESFLVKSSNGSSKSCRVSQDGSTSSSVTSSIIMSNNNLINDLNIYREHLEFSNVNGNNHYEDETVYGQVYLNNSQRIYQSLKSGELRRDLKNETSV